MNAKVIYIAGVPACGKTTLFRLIRERLFINHAEFKCGKVRGIESVEKQYKMLGVFDNSLFEGTDRLSMTVINDAINYVRDLNNEHERCVLFVEGDRLFNYRFLSEARANLILLDASAEELKKRHIRRSDNQTETFLKSRRSKVENFAKKYDVSRFHNNTPEDAEQILQFIIKISKAWVSGK